MLGKERQELLSLPPEILFHVATYLVKKNFRFRDPKTLTHYAATVQDIKQYYDVKHPLFAFALSCKEIYHSICPLLFNALDTRIESLSSIYERNSENDSAQFLSKVIKHTQHVSLLIDCTANGKALSEKHLLPVPTLDSLKVKIIDTSKVSSDSEIISATWSVFEQIPDAYSNLRTLDVSCMNFLGDMLAVLTTVMSKTPLLAELVVAINIFPKHLIEGMTEFANTLISLKHLRKFTLDYLGQVARLYIVPLDILITALQEVEKFEDFSLIYFNFQKGVKSIAALRILLSLNRLKRFSMERAKLTDEFFHELMHLCRSANLSLTDVRGPTSMFTKVFGKDCIFRTTISKFSIGRSSSVSLLFTRIESSPSTGRLETLEIPKREYFELDYDDNFYNLAFSTIDSNLSKMHEITLFVPNRLTFAKVIECADKLKSLHTLDLNLDRSVNDVKQFEEFFDAVRRNKSLKVLKIEGAFLEIEMAMTGDLGLKTLFLGVENGAGFDTLVGHVFDVLMGLESTLVPKIVVYFANGVSEKDILELEIENDQSCHPDEDVKYIVLRLFDFSENYRSTIMNVVWKLWMDGTHKGRIVVDGLNDEHLNEFDTQLQDLEIINGEICLRFGSNGSEVF
ncbi:hypothetical protein HK098_004171 [Nowakowskiella sp. JEL0407]|nr:hypothetical protein HK098_004171 [Nowakowskiella sp. JEL0407]